jgi:hypothetical protein
LIDAPHSAQYRAEGEFFSNPHFAQRRQNGAPHCPQNLTPSGLSAPQLEQCMKAHLANYLLFRHTLASHSGGDKVSA